MKNIRGIAPKSFAGATPGLFQNLLWSGLSALFSFAVSISQGFALGWYGSRFGAQIAVMARLKSAEGAFYISLGQRPRKIAHKAIKG
jgi:hypothetical protein